MSQPLHTERSFYMIRHGETCHNAAHLVASDQVLLTARGVGQAGALAPLYDAVCQQEGECHVVASGLQRAQDTAQHMRRGKPADAIDVRLNERSNGKLSAAVNVADYRRMRADGVDFTTPAWGRQKHEAYSEQVLSGLNDQLAQCPKDKTPVFVSHMGTIARAAYALGYPAELEFKNATMYHFVPDAVTHQWTINEVSLRNGQLYEVPLDVQALQHVPAVAKGIAL